MQQQVSANQQDHYLPYHIGVLLCLIGIYIIGLAMFVVPFMLIFNLNDTASGHSFLLHSESWLGPLSDAIPSYV